MTHSLEPWVIVAGGIQRNGGTDKANFALVEYLLHRGIPVSVITHNLEPELQGRPDVDVEIVPVPGGSWLAGEKLLSMRGWQRAQEITKRYPNARVVVNGGNCFWGDVNWVHRVHHAWSPESVNAPLLHRWKHRIGIRSAKSRESKALKAAKVVIANSELTRRHLIDHLGLDSHAVHAIRLGAEATWTPAGATERAAARTGLGITSDRPLVTFIGAIGFDRNKGIDTLLTAWSRLCLNPQWDAELLVAGSGRALPQAREMAAQSADSHRVRFLGFTNRIPELLAAADLVVSPVRYESFGLNVQEALCRGVPAIVSASAGVAEVYPSRLQDLLLPDPEDIDDLVRRMLSWRERRDHWRDETARYSHELRRYTWRDMAERFYETVTGTPAAVESDSVVTTGGRYQ